MTADGGVLPGTRAYRRLVLGVFCAGVATFAQLYAPQALLPAVAASFGASAAHASLLVSVATGALAVSVVPWSALAGRIGRARTMTVSVGLATVIGLVVPWAGGMTGLLVLRALQGAALGGLPALAIAHLGASVHPKHTARAGGLYVAGTTVGGLLGRVLAGPVGDHAGWRVGLASDSLLALLATGVYAWAVPWRAAAGPGTPNNVLSGVGGGPRARDDVLSGVGRRPRATNDVLTALRDPGLLALYAQGLLLMGGFVTVYNVLGFRLLDPPFRLSPSVTSLLFLTYLTGTASSAASGRLVAGLGRRRVLVGSIACMAGGALLMLPPSLPAVGAGLVAVTVGFFGAHATASSWAGVCRPELRSQAGALYTFAYYAGSSVLGWVGGLAWSSGGPAGVSTFVVALCAGAAVVALLALGRPVGART